jgi:hypothetical protein
MSVRRERAWWDSNPRGLRERSPEKFPSCTRCRLRIGCLDPLGYRPIRSIRPRCASSGGVFVSSPYQRNGNLGHMQSAPEFSTTVPRLSTGGNFAHMSRGTVEPGGVRDSTPGWEGVTPTELRRCITRGMLYKEVVLRTTRRMDVMLIFKLAASSSWRTVGMPL